MKSQAQQSRVEKQPPGRRIRSIDQFRGLAILLMILVNYLAGVNIVPAFLKHPEDIGLTIADLVAPFFIFAIGLGLHLSVRRRLQTYGIQKTVFHLVRRNLALIGIGAIISSAEELFLPGSALYNWGVLQAIGCAGLITLTVLFLKPHWQMLAGLVLLVFYQFFLDNFMLEIVLNSSHGGIFGSIAWAAMLMIATASAGFIFKAKHPKTMVPVAALCLVAGGILLAFIIPISKSRVSASYILISLATGGILYYLFYLLGDRLHLSFSFLVSFGKNPLVLYFLHFVLRAFVVLPGIPWWYENAALWLLILQLSLFSAFLYLTARFLEKKNIILSL